MLLAVAAVVAGCSENDGRSHPSPELPAEPEAVVLQFQTGGGFAGPCCDPWAVPEVTAYAGGRVVHAAPSVGRVPGVRDARISESDLSRLLADARAAGLLDAQPPDAGAVCCDMPYTNVVIADTTRTQEFEVTGLEVERTDGLTDEQVGVRRAVADLRARLIALAERDGTGTDYLPEELAAYVFPPIQEDTEPTPWPVDQPLGEGGTAVGPVPGFGDDGRCLHLTGEDDVGTVLDAARRSPSNLWSDNGQVWTVIVRPLLPHEHGCQRA